MKASCCRKPKSKWAPTPNARMASNVPHRVASRGANKPVNLLVAGSRSQGLFRFGYVAVAGALLYELESSGMDIIPVFPECRPVHAFQ